MNRLPLESMTINPHEVLRQMQIEPESTQGVEALTRIAYWERTLKPTLSAAAEHKWIREPEKDGEPGAVYCAITLGPEISKELDALSHQGKMWETTLLDMLADQWLLAGTSHLFQEIAGICKARSWGMTTRKMPGAGYPLSLAEKIIHEVCPENDDLRYFEPGFLEPIKSLAYFYEIQTNGTIPPHDEECESCNRKECVRRQTRVLVEIIRDGEITSVNALRGNNLLNVLNEAGCAPEAPCGGRGVCGRCLVEIQSESDKRQWVRACMHTVEFDLKVWIPAGESWQMASEQLHLAALADPYIKRISAKDYFSTLHSVSSIRIEALNALSAVGESMDSGWFIEREGQIIGYSPYSERVVGAAIDMGSTTIVLRFIDLETGTVISSEGFSNPLRSYGADILSRLTDTSKFLTMTEIVRRRLEQAFTAWRHRAVRPAAIAIAGNNAMIQILLGLPSEGLARAPYWHWIQGLIEVEAGDVWPEQSGIMAIMPGTGPFTGGDLTAGIIHCGIHKTQKKTLYMDLGTNGEMALGNGDAIAVSAAAAGPAFESLEGSVGVGAVPGAIRKVQYLGSGRWHTETIEGKEPIGLCGSGLISLMAELLRYGLIGTDGTFTEEDETSVTVSPGIGISQQDIRNFQLAKAALRAGVDVLLNQRGWQAGELDQIIIAGGFSRDVTPRDLVAAGLLPEVDRDSVLLVGNACLGGVCDFLLNKDVRDGIYNAKGTLKALNLAEQPEFQELFIKHIDFS